MIRTVELLLVGADGEPLGRLPAWDAEIEWWPETESVQRDARDQFGVDVTVVRLLEVLGRPDDALVAGGRVSYLAELHPGPGSDAVLMLGPDGLRRVQAAVKEDQPARAWWARPGGVALAVAWADERLHELGRPRTGRAVQVKSWNLSLVLRLPTGRGPVWLKATPPFLGHEGAVMAGVSERHPDLVPTPLAYDRDRHVVLLEHVPGEDQWQAPVELLARMVRGVTAIQAGYAARVSELLGLGLPDARLAGLPAALTAVLDRPHLVGRLGDQQRRRLDAVVDALPGRAVAVAECGIPEGLVRGDFHPGNWRSDGTSLTLLDWGDSEVGHPLLDAGGFLGRVEAGSTRDRVRAAWVDAWRAEVPGCEAARAMRLLEPLGPLRAAVVYQRFLDHIEPDEWPYHEPDVPRCLMTAAADDRLLPLP